MFYFDSKSELKTLLHFKDLLISFWNIESSVIITDNYYSPNDMQKAIISQAANNPNYMTIRNKITKLIISITSIAHKYGIPYIYTSYPAPAIGGAIIKLNLFESILFDSSHGGVDKHLVIDALEKTIGQCEINIKKDLIHILNPLFWIWQLIAFVLKIPFYLLAATGFSIEKLEDNFIGKTFKIIELIVIGYILYNILSKNPNIINIIEHIKSFK